VGKGLEAKEVREASESRSLWAWLAYVLGGVVAVFIMLLAMVDFIR